MSCVFCRIRAAVEYWPPPSLEETIAGLTSTFTVIFHKSSVACALFVRYFNCVLINHNWTIHVDGRHRRRQMGRDRQSVNDCVSDRLVILAVQVIRGVSNSCKYLLSIDRIIYSYLRVYSRPLEWSPEVNTTTGNSCILSGKVYKEASSQFFTLKWTTKRVKEAMVWLGRIYASSYYIGALNLHLVSANDLLF